MRDFGQPGCGQRAYAVWPQKKYFLIPDIGKAHKLTIMLPSIQPEFMRATIYKDKSFSFKLELVILLELSIINRW